MGNKAAAAVIIAAALALTGCSTAASNTVEKAGTTAAPAAAPATTPPPSVAAFGDSVKFPEGISVTTKATIQAAGPYASGAVEGKIVVVEVSVTNNSTEPFNAALTAYPKVTYGAKGDPAQHAFDGDKTGGNIGNLLPGETQTATQGYGIPAAGLSDLRVEFNGPKFGDNPAVFKGAVK